MLASDVALCGRLALRSFRQLDEPACDEVIARQAVKNLVYLALPLYQRDSASGAVPRAAPTANVSCTQCPVVPEKASHTHKRMNIGCMLALFVSLL